MQLREITIPVSRVRGVGPATAEILTGMGLTTVGELLSHWPRDWDDRTRDIPLAEFASAPKVNTTVTVIAHEWIGFGRMRTLKLIVEDAAGTRAALACFNRPFLEKSFPPESNARVNGAFLWKYGEIQSANFEIEKPDEASASVLPVYPLSAGLTQTQMRKIIRTALSEYGKGIDSPLPPEILSRYNLPSPREMLQLVHLSATLEEAERGRKALVFEELFLFEAAVGRRALERRGRLPALSVESDIPAPAESAANNASASPIHTDPLLSALAARLPFELTDDQYAVLSDILTEIQGPIPMARLLQGDVGSGKTLVAFFAAVLNKTLGGQSALMAPTELLARQHAESAARLLEPLGLRIAYLTGNLKAQGRTRLLQALADGEIDLVIGTHALFSSGVQYKNLTLVIIDEQHRFGVLQRSTILEKSREKRPDAPLPHLLMMSATPIPRTLALSVYGDMDVSVLRTMPRGRLPVITHLTKAGNEARVYEFVRRELARGHQAYFIYPLISDSAELSLKSAEEMYLTLKNDVFRGENIALIHSRIPEEEQRSIMADFRDGKIAILAATSVVEVGVDVANATCMVIEHAERFGLSALHQLRGRVGRGKEQSYCFFVYAEKLTEDAKARLKVLHETTDGFRIAEEDLRIRGPGELTGVQQSGYLAFSIADPIRDAAILQEARVAAFTWLEESRLQ